MDDLLFPPEPALVTIMNTLSDRLHDLDPDNSYTVVICGGTAAQLHLGANHRPTTDIDAEITPYPHNLDFTALEHALEKNGEKIVYFWDTNFHASLGLLHEDYLENAIEVPSLQCHNLKTLVLEAHDLVINKLTRWEDPDRLDTAALAEAGLLNIEYLQILIDQALAGNPISESRNRAHSKSCLELIRRVQLNRKNK